MKYCALRVAASLTGGVVAGAGFLRRVVEAGRVEGDGGRGVLGLLDAGPRRRVLLLPEPQLHVEGLLVSRALLVY